MKRQHVVLVWGLVLAASACAPVNRSIFDPKTPLVTRVLPLEIHIMDPNVEGSPELGDAPTPLLPTARVIEARYIIKKDFRRNVFEPGDPVWGHLVVRVSRNASTNWTWFVASTCSLYTLNLLGFPIMSQTSEVTIALEILDAQRRQVAQLTAKGTGAEYSALYWGRPTPGVVRVPEPDFSGPQMVHAEALRGALDDAKRQLEARAGEINTRLRAARPS